MDIKKFVPWNWFKKESSTRGQAIPVKHISEGVKNEKLPSVNIFRDEMDRLFDGVFDGFGVSPFRSGSQLLEEMQNNILRPRLDLSANEKEYTISVEIPGVSKKDVSIELVHDTLTISGEKKQEKEEKKKNFYKLERSYGSFQRILSLPEDANGDKVEAEFKNGVLNIRIPRVAISGGEARNIEIRTAE